MKWPVVPESATACGAVSTLLDEPTVEVEDERVFGITKSLKFYVLLLNFHPQFVILVCEEYFPPWGLCVLPP